MRTSSILLVANNTYLENDIVKQSNTVLESIYNLMCLVPTGTIASAVILHVSKFTNGFAS